MDEERAGAPGRNFKHVIIDAKARPDKSDLKELAAHTDLLIGQTRPDALAFQTICYRVQFGVKSPLL